MIKIPLEWRVTKTDNTKCREHGMTKVVTQHLGKGFGIIYSS